MNWEVKTWDKGLSGDVVELWSEGDMIAQASLDDGFYLRATNNRDPLGPGWKGYLWKPEMSVNEKEAKTVETLFKRIDNHFSKNLPYDGLFSTVDLTPYLFRKYVEEDGLQMRVKPVKAWINPEDSDDALGTFAATHLTGKSIFLGMKIPFAEGRLKKKILHPTKFWDEFLEAYSKTQALENDWQSIDEYIKEKGEMETALKVFSNVLINTHELRGLSIEYTSHNLEDVYDFFRILTTGESLVEGEPLKEPITDPWEVEMPTIENTIKCEA